MLPDKPHVNYYVQNDNKKIPIYFHGNNRLDIKIKYGEFFKVSTSSKTFHPNDVFAEPQEEGFALIIIAALVGCFHPLAILIFSFLGFWIRDMQQRINQRQADYFNYHKI